MQKRWFIISVVWALLFQGCDSFMQRNFPTAERIASERIDTINWNQVDRFPLFESCDEMADKETQRACFENTFTTYIHLAMEMEEVTVKKTVNDTVILDLKINHEGIVSILNIQQSDLVAQEIPYLRSYFDTSIKKLPKIFPALKNATSANSTQTVPVGMRFSLPIIIHVE